MIIFINDLPYLKKTKDKFDEFKCEEQQMMNKDSNLLTVKSPYEGNPE